MIFSFLLRPYIRSSLNIYRAERVIALDNVLLDNIISNKNSQLGTEVRACRD